MQGINARIFEYIDTSYYITSDDIKTKFATYLAASVPQKERLAKKLVFDAMKNHGKADLEHQIVHLGEFEKEIFESNSRKRDHKRHAVLTYLLGIALLSKGHFYNTNAFEWKLASLFHDICYPLEFAIELMNKFLARSIDSYPQGNKDQEPFSFNISNIVNLPIGNNALDLIQNKLTDMGLKVKFDKLFNKNNDLTFATNNVKHGQLSALHLLNIISRYYNKYNPKNERKSIIIKHDEGYSNYDFSYFENQIVSACAAIFLHDLPDEHFSEKICKEKSPTAYLLKLCDEIQDWERPLNGRGNGRKFNKPEDYSLDFEDYNFVIKGRSESYITNTPQKLNNVLDSVNVKFEMME